jgi:hypothetical protein
MHAALLLVCLALSLGAAGQQGSDPAGGGGDWADQFLQGPVSARDLLAAPLGMRGEAGAGGSQQPILPAMGERIVQSVRHGMRAVDVLFGKDLAPGEAEAEDDERFDEAWGRQAPEALDARVRPQRRRGSVQRADVRGLISRQSPLAQHIERVSQSRLQRSAFMAPEAVERRALATRQGRNMTDWAGETPPCNKGIGHRAWFVNETAPLCSHKHCVLWEIECPASTLRQVFYTGPINGTGAVVNRLNRYAMRNYFPGNAALTVFQNCTVTSLLCRDLSVYNMKETYNVQNCRATSFNCAYKRTSKTYEVLPANEITVVNPANARESVAQISVANSTNCDVQLACDEPVDNYGRDSGRASGTVFPQAFGWLLWGARCSTQKVVCNGVYQQYADGFTPSWEFANNFSACTTEFSACTFEEEVGVLDRYLASIGISVAVPTKEKCDHIEALCEGDLVSATRPPASFGQGATTETCRFLQLPVPSSVCKVDTAAADAGWVSSWPDVECRPHSLLCNGTATSATNVPAQHSGFVGCTVEELSCSSNTSSSWEVVSLVPSLGSGNCSIESFSCPNPTGALVTGNYSTCVVAGMVCDAESRQNVSCTRVVPVCADAAACQLSPASECADCSGPLNVSKCVCPLDRYGETCASKVPFTCEANLQKPQKDCKGNLKYWFSEDESDNLKLDLLDGDWPCLVYKLNRPGEMEWTINCEFDPGFGYPEDFPNSTQEEYAAANFSYALVGPPKADGAPRFVLTANDTWALRWKIFNFNRLSDNGEAYDLPMLSADQMTGKQPVYFRTRTILDKIDAQRFWHGNRLYSELSWDDDSKPDGAKRVLAREFMDNETFTKHKGTELQEPDIAATVGWSVALSFLGLLIIGYLLASWRRRRREKKFLEAKQQ